ncbi:hypothetical protein CesoFtcFv8_017822 [Champsocephalus esox]|uniref:Galectin n=1 Tax=Champsocephalus esox TaxID=159716 RepID=A0AAN8GQM4_9TELE|nr:hypothetical protein CesoFtcFv8_017822 [Champsocephalus esox]
MADFSLTDALGDDSPSKAKNMGNTNPPLPQGVIPQELQVQGVIPLELQVQGDTPLELQVQEDTPLELQFQGDTLLDPPGRGPRGSSHISLVAPEHQGSTRDPLLPLEASTPGLGSPDSTPLHLELQDSSLLALEPQASFPGSSPLSTPGIIPLKELQDSSPEALPLTQPDPFPLAPEPPLVHIKICLLILDVSPEETGCTGRGGPGAFPPAAGPGAFPGFPAGGFPPMPTGSWGPPAAGGYPAAPGPFGPGPMGPYGGPPAPGGMMMPYDLPLHSGILPQLVVTIEAEPVPGAERFQVDFIKETPTWGGCWGPEERDGHFPFGQGRRFELKILVDEDCFKVAVDGSHLLEFEHRVGGMEEVTLLRVQGDMVLHSVAPNMI